MQKRLKSWQPGQSGNPAGRKVGSRNIKSVIIELLEDPEVYRLLPEAKQLHGSTPIRAIVCTLIAKALEGDVKAADTLLKHALPKYMPDDVEGGFFSGTTQLIIKVVEPDGSLKDFQDPNSYWARDDEPSQLKEPQPVIDVEAEERVSF